MTDHQDELVVPCLRVISPSTAAKAGYVEITTGIHAIREAHIFDSVQKTLRTCDAVWIEKGTGFYSAARKRSDIKDTEGEMILTADHRRDSNLKGGKP